MIKVIMVTMIMTMIMMLLMMTKGIMVMMMMKTKKMIMIEMIMMMITIMHDSPVRALLWRAGTSVGLMACSSAVNTATTARTTACRDYYHTNQISVRTQMLCKY